jgi:hypothetical protein
VARVERVAIGTSKCEHPQMVRRVGDHFRPPPDFCVCDGTERETPPRVQRAGNEKSRHPTGGGCRDPSDLSQLSRISQLEVILIAEVASDLHHRLHSLLSSTGTWKPLASLLRGWRTATGVARFWGVDTALRSKDLGAQALVGGPNGADLGMNATAGPARPNRPAGPVLVRLSLTQEIQVAHGRKLPTLELCGPTMTYAQRRMRTDA